MSDDTTQENTDELEGAIDQATEAVSVQANHLAELGATGADGQPIGLDGVLGVPVQLTVRLGKTHMSLAQLVDLAPGSLIPLDRDAHEPADIFVNGKLVARGEVVTIDDKYAVRVCDIIPA